MKNIVFIALVHFGCVDAAEMPPWQGTFSTSYCALYLLSIVPVSFRESLTMVLIDLYMYSPYSAPPAPRIQNGESNSPSGRANMSIESMLASDTAPRMSKKQETNQQPMRSMNTQFFIIVSSQNDCQLQHRTKRLSRVRRRYSFDIYIE